MCRSETPEIVAPARGDRQGAAMEGPGHLLRDGPRPVLVVIPGRPSIENAERESPILRDTILRLRASQARHAMALVNAIAPLEALMVVELERASVPAGPSLHQLPVKTDSID